MFEARKIKWSAHCLERMQERDIRREDVKIALCMANCWLFL
ncbi:DUF4258 domain-containing protein [Clostridium sp. Marseille-P2415]